MPLSPPDWRDDEEFASAMRAKFGDEYIERAKQRGSSRDGMWKEMAWAYVGWKAREDTRAGVDGGTGG